MDGMASSQRRARVLVVDDDPLIGRALQRLLQPRHTVMIECDPNQAVARVTTGQRFHLILCDLHMPGLRGDGVLKAILGMPSEERPRFVYMTGGVFDPRDREALDAAPGGYVMKPFDLREIREIVDRAAAATDPAP